MSRKLMPLAVVLAIGAAACAEPPNPEPDFGSGVRFVPLVADPLNNAGLDPSVVVTEEGRPIVGYFAFPEEVPEGGLVETRPVTSPSIPGVLAATVNEEGVWTRGALALQEEIPNVDVAFNPGFEPTVGDLTAANVTGLDVVLAGDTLHAVWGARNGLFYGTGSADPASTTPFTIERVSRTPPVGVSLAVDGGTPWIGYYTSASDAASVIAATKGPNGWETQGIAEAPGCATCRTAVMAGSGDVAVAYAAAGGGVEIATNDGESGWTSFDVVASGGEGLAGAATPNGFALSFYSDGAATIATGTPGSLETRPAAPVAEGTAAAPGAGTSIAVDEDGTLWMAWVDAAEGVAFASGDNEVEPIDTGGDTAGGVMPSVAVTPDGSAAYLSWYDTENEDLLVGAYGELEGLAIAEPSPEPPPPEPQPVDGAECTEVQDGTVAIVAVSLQFDTSCIRALAQEPFTIEFTNEDPDQHNVSIYPSADEVANPILQEPPFGGPADETYEVPALEVGQNYFQCDVHPTTMNGIVDVVEELGGGGGGGGEGGTGATGATGATAATGATGEATGATGTT
jgi:plastocyanin